MVTYDGNDLMNEAHEEYELCIKQPQLYQQKVDSISDLFRLKGNDRLMGDNCLVYIVGKYVTAPVMMFGINPGYSKINNLKEDSEARISWQNYVSLYQNFFTYFEQNKFRSPYYTALYYLTSGLVGQKKYTLVDKWKLFDTYISNLELIPYHLAGLTLPSNFNSLQLNYISQRLQNNIRFARKYKPRLFIFNGNAWYILLIKHGFIPNYEKVKVTEKFNIYFFEIEGIPSGTI